MRHDRAIATRPRRRLPAATRRAPRRGAVALLLLALLAACAPRPAAEASLRFAHALAAAATGVEAGIAAVGDQERRYRATAAAARYLEAAPGTTAAAAVRLPARDPTNADIAQAVLRPGFDILNAYARELVALGGEEAVAPLRASTAALKTSFTRGLEALRAGPLAVPEPALVAGRRGADVILALIEGLAERRLARDLARVVENADPAIADLGALIKAVVGENERAGLRLTLRTLDGAIELERRLILAELRGDPRVSRRDRLAVFERIVQERELAPAEALLDRIVDATEAMVAAHAALRRPADRSTRAAVEQFVAAVEGLVDAYQRLRRLGA